MARGNDIKYSNEETFKLNFSMNWSGNELKFVFEADKIDKFIFQNTQS